MISQLVNFCYYENHIKESLTPIANVPIGTIVSLCEDLSSGRNAYSVPFILYSPNSGVHKMAKMDPVPRKLQPGESAIEPQ